MGEVFGGESDPLHFVDPAVMVVDLFKVDSDT
jgi:hypothetical protein